MELLIQLQILLVIFVVGHLDQGISLRIFLLVCKFQFLLSFQCLHHRYFHLQFDLYPVVEISYKCWQNGHLLFVLFPNLFYLTSYLYLIHLVNLLHHYLLSYSQSSTNPLDLNFGKVLFSLFGNLV